MALEESQSLLLEMIIWPQPAVHCNTCGRCWRNIFGVGRARSGSMENLYRNLIRVRRGLIRTEADELTYPVHIMLRYELEKQILDGEPCRSSDLPEAWSDACRAALGIRPANDVEGCLQDIHWAVGHFGYFPSYALGGVIAAQIYDALRVSAAGAGRADIEAVDCGVLFGVAARRTCTASARV